MDDRLTLRMDDSAISGAKQYAAEHGTSVSNLVENFFRSLPSVKHTRTRRAIPSHSITARLGGSLKPKTGARPVSIDDYNDYRLKKYQG